METRMKAASKGIWMLKSLLAAYIVTGILLLLLSFMMYKFDLGESKVTAGIVVVYVLATLAGGVIIGKLAKVKRFVWGLSLGIAYFALLLLISLGVYKTLHGDGTNIVTTFLLCAGGGMLGGMIS